MRKEEHTMNRIVAIILAMVILLGSNSIAFAISEEYPVYFGVKWGDSIDEVQEIIGRGREKSVLGVITTLEYNSKFGQYDADYVLYFNDEGLYCINIVAINIDDLVDMSEICIDSLVDIYGEPKKTDLDNALRGGQDEVEDGNVYMWIVNSDTGLYVLANANLVDIRYVHILLENDAD